MGTFRDPVARGPKIIPTATGLGGTGGAVPGGGLTLDALMARQKELAGRTVEMPEMRSPWQGAAYALERGLQGFQAGRAERDATQGRDALAQAIAQIDPNTGEMPPEARAAMAALMPEQSIEMTLAQVAAKRREAELQRGHTWDVEGREDTQAAAAAAAAQAQAETARLQGSSFAHADTSREDTQAASADAATLAAEREAEAATATRAAEAAKPLTDIAKIDADIAAGRVTPEDGRAAKDALITKSSPDNWQDVVVPGQPITQQRNAKTNELRSVQRQTTGADRKTLWGEQDDYVNTATSASALRRAKALLEQGINTGYTAGAKTFGSKAFGLGDKEAVKRTDEYNRIMNQEAIAAMTTSLKGATSGSEMAEFIKNMNDPTLDPGVKAKQIERMMLKVDAFQRLQQARITDLGGDVPRVDEPVPSTSPDLPSGVTEEDIKFTMEQRNMSREEVLTELKKRAGNAP